MTLHYSVNDDRISIFSWNIPLIRTHFMKLSWFLINTRIISSVKASQFASGWRPAWLRPLLINVNWQLPLVAVSTLQVDLTNVWFVWLSEVSEALYGFSRCRALQCCCLSQRFLKCCFCACMGGSFLSTKMIHAHQPKTLLLIFMCVLCYDEKLHCWAHPHLSQ